MTNVTAASPTIRKLTLPEAETLVDWAAAEGWNPGRNDAAAFQTADPGGLLGGFLGGEMVSGISAIAYGADFGFIGLYICRPHMRGKGYGKAVWDAGMARLEGRTVGLDGVPAQQANYASMGFVSAYRTFRYSGRLGSAYAPVAGAVGDIRAFTPDRLDAIAAFDAGCFPAPRRPFLERWLAPPHFTLIAAEAGAVRGYGVARACREGFKIGPLFARVPATAECLLHKLAQACGGAIHIDVPESQVGFAARLRQAGLSQGFETARMYRGPAPVLALDDIYGVTTLELG
jgi:hypothetical protein